MDISILLAAFGIVFTAELVGDKSIYTISSIATRFNTIAVFLGLSIAFGVKMLVAVLVGQVLADIPPVLIAVISAVTFFATAFVIWYKKSDTEAPVQSESSFSSSTAVSFSSIFFIEWGDIGQLTAAALAVQYKAPATVWLGATLALMAKGLLAITLGVALRKYLPKKPLYYLSICLCIIMGIASVVEILLQYLPQQT